MAEGTRSYRLTRGGALRTALAAAVLFAVAMLAPLDPGMGTGDASWFLRVACRLASGEVLYRDVFYGAGPLAPYLAALFARLSGGEMMALRFLQFLLFSGIAATVWSILRRAGVDARWQLAVFCGIVVYGFEPAFSIYNVLSTLLLLGVMRSALEWEWGGGVRWLWIAGVLAGLEFGAKQNVAVLAAVALGGPLLARREWGGLTRLTAGFLAAAAGIAAAVWLSGGWDKFLEYGFAAKGRYLASGFPLSATLARYLAEMREAPALSYQLRVSYWFLGLALAACCLIVVAIAWLRVRDREIGFVACFAAAAALTVYPISDLSHVAYAIPVLLPAAAIAFDRMKLRQRWVPAAALAWFLPGTVWVGLSPALFAVTGQMKVLPVPHYRGVPVRTADYGPLIRNVHRLGQAVREGHRPYLITLYAGFYYLTTGLPNATPFDYPAASAFGHQGEARLIDSVRRREIPEVCLDAEYESMFLAPRVLIPFVRKELRPHADLGACTLYSLD